MSLSIPLTFALATCLLSVAAGLAHSEEDLILWGASYGPRTLHEFWRLITAMFLDTHYAQLPINVLAIFIFGRAVSRVTSPLYYCLVYLAAGTTGILMASLLAPQSVVSGSCLGAVASVGSLLASHFFDRRRHPTSPFVVAAAGLYWIYLMSLSLLSQLPIAAEAVETSLAIGFAGPFFLRLSRQHTLAPITGVFFVLLGLRIALGSLPSTVDRFSLEASLTSTRLETAHQLKMIDEKFLRGEISDLELADRLNDEVLQPSKRLLREIESAKDPSLDRAWLARNRAELRFRTSGIETMIAVYAAKTNLLEADELAHTHSPQLQTRLDRFWWGQLPTLRTREQQIIRLAQEIPIAASDFQRLRIGLSKDIRVLTEGAAQLECQSFEDWIVTLKNQVMFQEERLPSSALMVSPQSNYVPPGLAEELKSRIERAQRVDTSVAPYLAHQNAERQRLAQLEDFLKEMNSLITESRP